MEKCKKYKKSLTMLMYLLLIMGLMGCGKKKIDVMETLSLKYDGVNGYGTAELSNEYSWEEEALEAAEIKIDDLESWDDVSNIENAVSYELSPTENLSNGDEIIVKVSIDNEAVKKYKINLVGEEKKFTVSGLNEVEEVDLFENIDILYEGISPIMSAKLNNAFLNLNGYSVKYELDKDKNISAGDIITVTADYDQKGMLEKGYKAESDTKEFTVPNGPKYVTSLSEIPSELLEKMKKQAEDGLKASAANSGEKDSITGIEFLGNYFLKLKDGMWGNQGYNSIYMVYKMDVVTSQDSFSYYSYTKFQDLILLEDGTCSVDLSNCKRPNGFFEKIYSGYYFYSGYLDLDSLFNENITKNIDSYEYESNVIE